MCVGAMLGQPRRKSSKVFFLHLPGEGCWILPELTFLVFVLLASVRCQWVRCHQALPDPNSECQTPVGWAVPEQQVSENAR